MPRKYVMAVRGAHTLADGTPIGSPSGLGDEVSLSAQQEKDNKALIDGGVLVAKVEAGDEVKEGSENG